MAYEAVCVIETELPIQCKCADGTGIEKGAVVKMTDPLTVAATAAAADTFGGIVAGEKIASNGAIYAAVYRRGIFRVYLSGSCTVGDPATTDAAVNYFKSTSAVGNTTLSGTKIWGQFLETGTTGEQVLMELFPGCLASSAG